MQRGVETLWSMHYLTWLAVISFLKLRAPFFLFVVFTKVLPDLSIKLKSLEEGTLNKLKLLQFHNSKCVSAQKCTV